MDFRNAIPDWYGREKPEPVPVKDIELYEKLSDDEKKRVHQRMISFVTLGVAARQWMWGPRVNQSWIKEFEDWYEAAKSNQRVRSPSDFWSISDLIARYEFMIFADRFEYFIPWTKNRITDEEREKLAVIEKWFWPQYMANTPADRHWRHTCVHLDRTEAVQQMTAAQAAYDKLNPENSLFK